MKEDSSSSGQLKNRKIICTNFLGVQMKCEANPAGKNSSFIFTVCVKSVPFYHFKLASVVTDMAFKKFFKTHF